MVIVISLGEIAVGDHPVHATVVSGRVFVATMGERSVAVIDRDGTVTRIETGVLGPSHFAVAAGKLFVSCTAGDVVAIIDPIAGVLEGRIPVGVEPHDLAAHDGLVYVGSRGDGTITVIDAESATVTGEVDIDDNARVGGIAIDAEIGRGFAVDQRGCRLVSFTLEAEPTRIGEATVGADPYEVLHRDRLLYVPGRGDGTVLVVDANLRRLARYDGFNTPVTVVQYEDAMWIIDRSAAELVRIDGLEVPTPAPAITGQSTLAGILLSHYDNHAISLVDPERGVRWTTSTPEYPFGTLVI